MKFDTKDELGYFGIKELLNQLGRDQGYRTPEAWDMVLHDYCEYLCNDGEGYQRAK